MPPWLQSRLSSVHRLQELPSRDGLSQTHEPGLVAAVADHRGCSRFCSSSCVLRVPRQFLVTTCASISPSRAVCYPKRAISGRGRWLLRVSGPVQQSPCHRGTARVVPEGATSTCAARVRFLSLKHFLETSPLRNGRRFWRSVARQNQV
jgi:hypothetical protein